uniref:Single-stranded DNA-binding protein n=1 Tax=Paulinella micropora TaxID=1928728 RepID=A0A385I1N1_9EUKA|nr:hypothetical protein PMNZ_870 [Paulinella micropora]AXY63785.1 hypothetical protein PMNZ_870 [Paulinella micropora]
MNHCLLEALILEIPQINNQDNLAMVETMVEIKGLKPNDPATRLKVVGWGNIAHELQSKLQIGQRCLLEGRLQMNMIIRPDGLKEKKAEMIVSKVHPLTLEPIKNNLQDPSNHKASTILRKGSSQSPIHELRSPDIVTSTWNTSPLIPDPLQNEEDEIPF